jgi:hypothetical protein
MNKKINEYYAVFLAFAIGSTIEKLIPQGPRSSSFCFPRNLYNHMDRQAHTHDTVFV